MEDTKLHKISIKIGDKTYNFNATSDEEVILRMAAQEVNDGILETKKKYQGCTTVDALSIIAFTANVHLKKLSKNEELNTLVRQIQDLDSQLAAYLDTN